MGRLRRLVRSLARRRVLALLVLVAFVTTSGYQNEGRSATAESFVGDFEVGSPGWQQFDALQYQLNRPLAESFALVEAPRRQGHRAVRITSRQGYSRFGYNEATLLVWQGREKEGDEYWYAWSTYFPRDWVEPFKWGIFAQWHANLRTAPIIGFSARGNRVDFVVRSGLTDEARNVFEVDRGVPLMSTLSKGRWNDFVVRVRWSLRAGLIEVYHRVEGAQALRKVVSWANIPTFQITRDGRGVGTYLLLGMYRGSYCPQPTTLGCTSSLGEQAPNVVYHDGFVRARTFEDAVARAFPGAQPELPTSASAVQREGSRLPAIEVRPAPSARAAKIDRGCKRCRVTASDGRAEVRIAGAADDKDTAVVEYRVRQRAATVVSHRLRVVARRLSGRLVVTQIRRRDRTILVELYANRGTLRLASPAGALRGQGFDIETGIALADARTVEMRLSSTSLLLGVEGRLIVHVPDVTGPKNGTRLTVRIGIDRYQGRLREGPVRAIYDELVVGSS